MTIERIRVKDLFNLKLLFSRIYESVQWASFIPFIVRQLKQTLLVRNWTYAARHGAIERKRGKHMAKNPPNMINTTLKNVIYVNNTSIIVRKVNFSSTGSVHEAGSLAIMLHIVFDHPFEESSKNLGAFLLNLMGLKVNASNKVMYYLNIVNKWFPIIPLYIYILIINLPYYRFVFMTVFTCNSQCLFEIQEHFTLYFFRKNNSALWIKLYLFCRCSMLYLLFAKIIHTRIYRSIESIICFCMM